MSPDYGEHGAAGPDQGKDDKGYQEVFRLHNQKPTAVPGCFAFFSSSQSPADTVANARRSQKYRT